MATDLKVSVRKQVDRLRRDLTAATGRVAALRDEIKRYELIHDMLEGKKTSKRPRRRRPTIAPLRRGSRGTMIDWNAVFETLPSEFSLDTISAHETAGGKSRAYLRQMVARWSKAGWIKRTGRGMYRKN